MNEDRHTDDAPKVPVGPPPVGLIIASMLNWEALTTHNPGIEEYWLPADGRPVPPGCTLDRILKHRGQPSPSLPDLRGKVLQGADSFETASGFEPGWLVEASGEQTQIATHRVFFYVRYN